MSVTIHLHDYTLVEKDIEAQKKELAELLCVPESMVTDAFCLTLQGRMKGASYRDIHLVNSYEEAKAPTLVSLYQGSWYTQDYVGVIRFDVERKVEEKTETVPVVVNIHSRFDMDHRSQFLMYVFEKAFSARGRIYEDMDIEGRQEFSWDYLLLLIFLRQLHDAMKKGMFRQYREYEYNNSNVRGRIDVARHIRENLMLSNGKIAYTTREYTVDNIVNILILKAYDCLDKKYHSVLRELTARDETVKKGIQLLRTEIESWKDISNQQVLKATGKKIVQSVYRNYEPLRRTAIAILRRLGINNFVNGAQSTSGLLINMPGLWEQFLYKEVFSKLTGETGNYEQKSYPILGGARELKPDFLLEKQRIVFDAKYKKHWGEAVYSGGTWKDAREDVFQIITYMHVFDCAYGGAIFPIEEMAGLNLTEVERPIVLEAKRCPDSWFVRLPYVIPAEEDFVVFRQKLDENAKTIVRKLEKLIEMAET